MSRLSGRVSTSDIILSGSIGVQKEINLDELTATENGIYEPSEGYDGYSKVTVEVPLPDPPVLDDITITENGHYTPPEGVDGYDDITVEVPEPEPKLIQLWHEFDHNGAQTLYPPTGYDGYSEVHATVNVPIRIHEATFTENGTYPIEENYDGYGPVTVNVPTQQPSILPLNIVANGTYTAPEGLDGYNPIGVNVPIPADETLTAVANGTYHPSSPDHRFDEVIVAVPGSSPDFLVENGLIVQGSPGAYKTIYYPESINAGTKLLFSVLDYNVVNVAAATYNTVQQSVDIPLPNNDTLRLFLYADRVAAAQVGGAWRDIKLNVALIPNDYIDFSS